ncbi:ribonuclease III [Hydromonas duriensis]|uniref:Ribonuclease 3 n=1 Tax=Hydromonas duriensis TaxID=1527608 RepID=A0A4R6Y8H2_9BURK|nr:ribonuclease III [Hydromonas duriensis]TDR31693.1 RNAse III [Hydromonas duriensis]
MTQQNPLLSLQHQLGYLFTDVKLLRQALTHRSYAQNHYERLEFLGDGVLNCSIARCLYDQFKDIKEGELSRIRAHLVKQDTLVLIAQDLSVSKYLLLGEGEMKSGGLNRPSILADAVEAMIGAIFLEAGFDVAQSVVARLYAPLLKNIDPSSAGKDAKTQLQERLQGQKLPVPKYDIIEIQGAAHEQVFTVSCFIEALQVRTQGEGSTRRLAEQQAARLAMDVLEHSQQSSIKKRN